MTMFNLKIQITNNGMTNWKDLTTLVALPKEPFIKYNDIPVTVSIRKGFGRNMTTPQ